MVEAIVGLLVEMIAGEAVSKKVVTRGPEAMVDGTEMRTGIGDMKIEIGTRQYAMRATGIGIQTVSGSIENSILKTKGGVVRIGNQAPGIGTQQLKSYHELKGGIHQLVVYVAK